MSLDKDVERILVTEEEAKAICKRLGEQISKDYEGKRLLLVSVLKGAVVFMADLMRSITCDCQIDFMAVSSYSGTKTTGVVKFKKDLDIDPDGCDILLAQQVALRRFLRRQAGCLCLLGKLIDTLDKLFHTICSLLSPRQMTAARPRFRSSAKQR